MHAKKLLGFSVVAFSLLFLVGCGKSTPTAVTSDQEVVADETTTTQTDTTSTSSTVTKDQCIEIMAYALKGADEQAKGNYAAFLSRAKKTEALQAKYGITENEYDQVCNGMLEDVSFMDAVQKRMTELK